MNNYRIYFQPSEEASNEYPTIMDTRAVDLDSATETAKAFLVMLGCKYHHAEVFEPWKSMWRSSGRRIIYSPNI